MNRYDVVILGAGAGAKMIWGALRGRSVAVVEQKRVGGECPFVACVPSKAMLRSARVWQVLADPQWAPLVEGRVPAAVAYGQAVRRRDTIVHGRDDSGTAAALEKAGAMLLRGTGRVVGPGVLEVDGVPVGYRDLVLDTGSAPVRPQLPGLDRVPVWTSDELLSSASYPRSVLVLGGGPVGCELSFLLATFGSAVTLVQRAARLVPCEEPEASAALLSTLTGVGVDVRLGSQVHEVTRHADGGRFALDTGPAIGAAAVVLAAGRRPRATGLGLDRLGVRLTAEGAVPLDDRCRVAGAEHLWAVGDVTGLAPFTHTAHYQGRVVAANLAGRALRADYRAIPRAVYVEPEMVAVGHTLATARAAGIEPLVASAAMSQAVRSNTEGAAAGWLRMLADPGTGAILGATAVGGHAAEWIGEVALAIRAGIPVPVAAEVVHPFPTYSEILEIPLWELTGQLEQR